MTLDWFLDLDFRRMEEQAAARLEHEILTLSFHREIVFDAAYGSKIVGVAKPTIKANLEAMGLANRFRVSYARTVFVVPVGYMHVLIVHVKGRRMRVQVPMKSVALPASGTARALFSAKCPECQRCLEIAVEVDLQGS
jgi:hypothetical protein